MTSTTQSISTSQSNARPVSASARPALPSTASGKKSPVGSNLGPTSQANPAQQSFPPNASQSSVANMAPGGSTAVQVNQPDAASSTNGRNQITPAVPAMSGTPTIVNGSNVLSGAAGGEHSRSASMTIGGNTNGGAQGKPMNLQFGSHPPVPSSAGPAQTSPNNLGVTAQMNPRLTSPQSSPSPIPQPATASGGRPPSGLHGQGNGVVFGSTGGDSNDPNRQIRGMAQNNLGPGPQHLRRESSQSSHGDMNNASLLPGPNRNYGSMGAGRGRGSFAGAYGNSMAYPQNNASHRPSPQARGSSNMGSGYYQGRQGYPNSPNMAARSPAMMPAIPVNPQMGQMQMANPGMPGQFGQFPPHMAQQGYGMPTPYDPSMYYPGGYVPQQMGFMAPQSPRPPYGIPQGQQGPYMQQYNGQAAPQQAPSMSRTSSQMSAHDRPSSAMSQPQAPSVSSVTSQIQPGPRNTSSPVPKTSAFTVPPKRASAAIVIKDPNSGAIKSFDKQPASPARATPSPVKAGTPRVPTPPSRVVSQADQTSRSDVSSGKTDEEKKNEMRDAVARKLAEDEAATKKEAAQKAAREKEEAAAKAKEAEAEAERLKAEADAKAKAQEEEEEEEAAAAAKAVADSEKPADKAADPVVVGSDNTKPQEESKSTDQPKGGADDIDFDALEAELAAMEAAEAAREAEYQKKKQAAKEEKERKEKEEAAAYEANMKQAEREAEEAEAARIKKRAAAEDPEEAAKAFAALKIGDTQTPPSAESPAADTPEASGTATPVSDAPMPPPAKSSTSKRDKPGPLKLETAKSVEPPQPTPAMKSLQSARKIADLSVVAYPSSVASPTPSLNANASASGKFKYNKEFLLQFQSVFKEKPSIDWDAKIRDTLGEGGETSGRPQSARTPSGMGSRTMSNRASIVPSNAAMGGFTAPQRAGPFNLPPGTTSEQRFAMSNNAMGRGNPMGNPFMGRPGGMPMGSPMVRGPSSQNLAGGFPGSPKIGSQRSNTRSGSKQSKMDKKKEEQMAAAMPLTAGLDLRPLAVSQSGWKPTSLASANAGPVPGGDNHLAPDVVQRKVKSNLNKMTPENFDKIAGQILVISAQSKDETDGRTLRQVIQLTFEKATDEAHWAPMYAKFCKRMLESMSNDIRDENIKDRNGNVVTGGNLFRKYLLNRCQEEFERGWKVNLPEKPEGVTEEVAMMSDEYYVAAAAKRRGLGLVKFIGELFKLGMLTERIMHECLKKLLDYGDVPDEAEVESLTSLLRTVGAQLDLRSTLDKGPQMMAVYFSRIHSAMEIPNLPSRLKFMLLDIQDLRRAGWQSKDNDKGPKTITEIHADAQRDAAKAEQERLQSQARGGQRLPMGRGDARNFSGPYGQMPPPDSSSSRVGTDDLRRLGNRAARNSSNPNGPAAMGPGGMFSSGRTGSGRRNLGPASALRPGEESGASSRTATPPAQKKDETDSTSKNAFSALAALDGESASVTTSPPSVGNSPPATNARPATERARSKSPTKESST